jgi:hypothetical protein
MKNYKMLPNTKLCSPNNNVIGAMMDKTDLKYIIGKTTIKCMQVYLTLTYYIL